MIKIKIRLIDGTEIINEDRSGSPIKINDNIGETLEKIKRDNTLLSFNPTNMEPFTVQGKDLHSIELILED